MTRFALDAPSAIRLLEDELVVRGSDSLVAPGALRSVVMSLLFQEVRAGNLTAQQGRARLEALAGMKIRLLADRVSRATAWKFAEQLGWDDTPAAEYLAVCALQADVLITTDVVLRDAAATLGLSVDDVSALSR